MKRRSLLCALLASPAWAQTRRQQSAPVYRCGNDGRQLSDQPCAAATPGSGIGFDQPSPRDAQAARDRAQQQSRQADALRQAREEREARPSPPPQRLSAAPAAASEPPMRAPARTSEHTAGGTQGRRTPRKRPKRRHGRTRPV